MLPRLATVVLLSLVLGAPPGVALGAERTVLGTDGPDHITASTGDRVFGLAGDDHLEGSRVMFGGAGNDTLDPMPGASKLLGQAGNDTINLGPSDLLLAKGGRGDDRISGGPVAGRILAGPGDDYVLSGGGPNLDVFGGAGDDQLGALGERVFGDSGNDSVMGSIAFGGQGNDDVNGTSVAQGGDGNDTVSSGGRGAATGDGGDDVITFYGPQEGGFVDCGAGTDKLILAEEAPKDFTIIDCETVEVGLPE